MRLFGRREPDARLLELLREAGHNASRAGRLLSELMSAFPERTELARELLVCEHEGDRIAHNVIHRIVECGPRTGIDSRDAYDLIRALDDVVDYADETADSLGLYGVEAPMAQAEQLAAVLERAAAAVERAIAAFADGRDLNSALVEIHDLENEGDRLSRDAIASLFATGVDPMVVIRWKDIVESLEQGVDSCETVAHVLEGLALKRVGAARR